MKQGAGARKFVIRARDVNDTQAPKAKPFYEEVLPPGAAVLMGDFANFYTTHAVPSPGEYAEPSGSTVFRVIKDTPQAYVARDAWQRNVDAANTTWSASWWGRPETGPKSKEAWSQAQQRKSDKRLEDLGCVAPHAPTIATTHDSHDTEGVLLLPVAATSVPVVPEPAPVPEPETVLETLYQIPRARLDDAALSRLRGHLTFAANASDDEPLEVFQETAEHVLVPRFYGVEHFGAPGRVDLTYGEALSAGCRLKDRGPDRSVLRPAQTTHFEALCAALDTPEGGGAMVAACCGFGKTVVSAHLIARLNVRTIVLVNRTLLVQQWRERIEQSMQRPSVGQVSGDVFDVEGKDIVIVMVQTLLARGCKSVFPPRLLKRFGFLIVDEVHNFGATTFHQGLAGLARMRTMGLSATPYRTDGRSPLLFHFLGPLTVSVEPERGAVDVRFLHVNLDTSAGKVYAEQVTRDAQRNHRILDDAKDLVFNHVRNVLILTARVEHALSLWEPLYEQSLAAARSGQPIFSASVLVGDLASDHPRRHDVLADKCPGMLQGSRYCVATYSMAKEALDLNVDTLIMAGPPPTSNGALLQCVGRVVRGHGQRAFVLDVVDDNVPDKVKLAADRQRVYESYHYGVTHEPTR